MATNKIVRLIAPSRSAAAASRFLEPVSRFLSSGAPPPTQTPTTKQDQNLKETKEEEEEDEEEEGEGGGEIVNKETGEIGGPKGPEPTRYGDWEQRGRCSDF
ncbi:unnamed protein product [Cochlearia groenlandica]